MVYYKDPTNKDPKVREGTAEVTERYNYQKDAVLIFHNHMKHKGIDPAIV